MQKGVGIPDQTKPRYGSRTLSSLALKMVLVSVPLYMENKMMPWDLVGESNEPKWFGFAEEVLQTWMKNKKCGFESDLLGFVIGVEVI